jgi:hypothetical protein
MMNHERQQQIMTAQPWFIFDLLEKNNQIICHAVNGRFAKQRICKELIQQIQTLSN